MKTSILSALFLLCLASFGYAQSWELFDKSNSDLPSNTINVVHVDAPNCAPNMQWIGTTSGLVSFDGSWTVYDMANSDLPNNNVLSLETDLNGNLWIGTGGGLAKFDRVNWTVYSMSNSGIPSNTINGVDLDSD